MVKHGVREPNDLGSSPSSIISCVTLDKLLYLSESVSSSVNNDSRPLGGLN